MKPWLQDPDFTLYHGDALHVLCELPSASVDCALTSPPFYGLRDYGVDGQIGLDSTPEEWCDRLVQVFREVRRALADHGTLWVECGDSYKAGTGSGRKPKDLMGTPWLLAFALRGPWYMGRITKDIDRVWLAAMVDAEGCIHIHRRKAGTPSGSKFTRKDGTTVNYERKTDTFGVTVSVSNTRRAIVEKCREVYGCGSISTHEAGTGVQQRKQSLHQWSVTGDQARDLLRELYPHLVAKQHEARLALACPTQDALAYQEAIKSLHNGGVPDLDGKAPASMWEPGFYLRQAIIWGKSNAMPESAKDRCTTAHSYVFLLSKKPRYYFDAEAISEPAEWARWGDQTTPKHNGTDTAAGWIPTKGKNELLGKRTYDGFNERWNAAEANGELSGRKNARSVWTIPTQGFAEAHFATWPEALVERIIKAGCPEQVCRTCGKASERMTEVVQEGLRAPGDNGPHHRPAPVLGSETRADALAAGGFVAGRSTVRETVGWSDCGHANYRPGIVLDPFMGSGTTALVARRLGRRSVGIELNPDYCALAAKRLRQLSLLAEGAA